MHTLANPEARNQTTELRCGTLAQESTRKSTRSKMEGLYPAWKLMPHAHLQLDRMHQQPRLNWIIAKGIVKRRTQPNAMQH